MLPLCIVPSYSCVVVVFVFIFFFMFFFFFKQKPAYEMRISDWSSDVCSSDLDLSWYLLDAHLNPVPKGCIGELYVGRAGLARGYHRRADLTATRFIPDPFDPLPGGRLYRTGDLARYRTDGSIEYIGRLDHQVKIRGFRIELGEIQARLQTLPAVQDGVVLTHEGPGGLQLEIGRAHV